MWRVVDRYDNDWGPKYFHSVGEAGDWVEASDDPLTYDISYVELPSGVSES